MCEALGGIRRPTVLLMRTTVRSKQKISIDQIGVTDFYQVEGDVKGADFIFFEAPFNFGLVSVFVVMN